MMIAVHSVHENFTVEGDARAQVPIIATNVYLRTAAGWRMIVHHASPAPGRGTAAGQKRRPSSMKEKREEISCNKLAACLVTWKSLSDPFFFACGCPAATCRRSCRRCSPPPRVRRCARALGHARRRLRRRRLHRRRPGAPLLWCCSTAWRAPRTATTPRAAARAASARLARAMPHFRGCSGEPNRMPRAYHSGDSDEIDWMLKRLEAAGTRLRGRASRSAATRCSSGWASAATAATRGGARAAAVSAPLDLAPRASALDRGLNRSIRAALPVDPEAQGARQARASFPACTTARRCARAHVPRVRRPRHRAAARLSRRRPLLGSARAALSRAHPRADAGAQRAQRPVPAGRSLPEASARPRRA